MTAQDIITLICGLGWVGTFVIFMFQRSDAKKDKHDELKKDVEYLKKDQAKAERDRVRIQLLLLMLGYSPEDEHELLTCAEHYFSKAEGHLGGDWWMTKKFYRFIEQQGIAKPSWFED